MNVFAASQRTFFRNGPFSCRIRSHRLFDGNGSKRKVNKALALPAKTASATVHVNCFPKALYLPKVMPLQAHKFSILPTGNDRHLAQCCAAKGCTDQDPIPAFGNPQQFDTTQAHKVSLPPHKLGCTLATKGLPHIYNWMLF